MANPSPLAEIVALAFDRALRERDLDVAELLLQALERLDAGGRCGMLLETALLAIADRCVTANDLGAFFSPARPLRRRNHRTDSRPRRSARR